VTNKRTTCDPIKPAPPVIKMFFFMVIYEAQRYYIIYL
jgi:hypothetical protein